MPFAATDPWLMPLLRRVCTRPGMFLGDERVRTLDVYLQAYGQARVDLGVPELVESEATLLDDFGRWLAATRNDTRHVAWPTFIADEDPSDRNVRTFFLRFEEFLRTRGETLSTEGEPGWPPEPWPLPES